MRDLTKGNIYKTFIIFAIPLVFSGLLSTAFNVINGIIAGKLLGEQGMAATGSTSALITFVSAICWGYTGGLAIYIAMLFGAGKYERLKSTLVTNTLLQVIVMFIICVLFVVFKNRVFDFLSIDTAVRKDAGIYFGIYMAGLVLILMNNHGLSILNAFGMSKYPFYMAILAAVIHISGTFICIKLLGMGVEGLAVSALTGAGVVDICYFFKIKKCFKEMGDTGKIKLDMSTVKRTVSFAIPVTFQQMIMYLSSFLISPMINAIGSQATVAYSVALKIYDVNAGVYQNSSKTLSNYAAQSVGAEQYSNLKKGVRVGFLQGLVFIAPFLIVSAVFAEPVCRMFFPKGAASEALTMAVTFVQLFLPLVIFNMVNNLFHSFFRGVKAMGNLVFLTAFGSASKLVLTLLLIPEMGMNGVWMGWVLSWITEAVAAVIIYRFGTWRKKYNL
ncbi:MAG: oligosaccharide flippase family protein [Clostridia bacterium]|nr:oligosaccharide flippase family protein [Clostridia bacterium]